MKKDKLLIKEWNLNMIRDIVNKRYLLKRTALEIYFIDGTSIFVNFP